MGGNRYDNWDAHVDKRIQDLISKGFYLETIYVYSATIEFVLQESIRYQEEYLLRLLKKSNLGFKKTDAKKLSEKSLGQLIQLFGCYCKDSLLISKLNEFNSFRKKVVHYLLDHSVSNLNEEAKKKQALYYELVSKVSRYNLAIIDKNLSAINRKNKKSSNIVAQTQKIR